MSKPLELTIYDRNEDGDYLETLADGGQRYVIALEDVEVYCMDKYLTDAELAAEYWSEEKGLGDVRCIAETRPGYRQIEPTLLGRVLTLHRFAGLPHHDEADS